MSINQNLIDKLKLPSMSQLGVVVKDMDKTIEYFEKVLGLGPFVRPDITFNKVHYYGKQVDSLWLFVL